MQCRISCLVSVFFIITHCSCTVYNNSIVSPFRNAVFTNSSIYIGGTGGIVVLNRVNLSEKNISKKYSNNWLLLHFDKNKMVIQCNEDALNISHCRKLTENLVDEENRVVDITVNIKNLPIFTKDTVSYGDIDIFVIAATSLRVSNNTYGIVSLTAENLTLVLTREDKKGPLNIELGENSNITFKSIFRRDHYVYFLFQVWDNGILSSSRLGKLCLYQNISETVSNYCHSYEDIKLNCTYNGITFQQIEHGIVYGGYLIVVFTKNGISIVCLFTWTDIYEHYKLERKTFLSCGSLSLGDKYFLPLVNLSNNCYQVGANCSSQLCKEIDGDFCNTFYHQTVTGSIPIQRNALYVVNNLITAITIQGTSEYHFIYLGTEQGQIGRVYFNPSMLGQNISYYRSINGTKVIQIQVERENMHIVTETTVEVVDFEECSLHTNCQSCILAQNPYCGWDLSSEQCHSNKTNWWISSTVGVCPAINMTYYNKIQAVNKYDIHFDVKAPDEVNCFDAKVTKESFKQSCKLNDIIGGVRQQPEHGFVCHFTQISLNTSVYLFSLQCNDVTVAKQIVEFYKCADFRSCIQCTTRPCGWRSDEFQCSSDDNLIQDKQKCLRNITSDTATKVAWRMDPVNISISVYGFEELGLEIIGSDFRCELVQNTSNMTVPMILDSNSSIMTCIGTKLESPDSVITKYTIHLTYNGIYFGNETILDVYTCEGLLKDKENCGECKSLLQIGYSCDWCSDERKCSENCIGREDICELAITQVFPRSGPVYGGTLLTFTGKSTGYNADNITVIIDGFTCKDVKIILPHVRFTCKTSAANSSQDLKGIITVNGKAYSNISFEYKQPTLDDFVPDKGIMSGNTTIKINGNNIGFTGPNRYGILFCNVELCLPCRIYENSKQHSIECKTENTTIPRNMTRLELTIDENKPLMLNKSFFYVSDPKIVLSNNTPSVMQSGGSKITINGEGFSNVGEVSVDKVAKSCLKPNDTTVICETPTLNKTGGQTIHVNFDGLRVDINVNYVQDPSFKSFPGIYKYDKESTIQIEGTNIILGATREDYFIQVGLDGTCFITDISMKTITCYPPKNVPRTNFSNTNIVFVVVKVGRIEKYIGDLEYREEVEILPIVVGVLGSAFVIVVVVGVTIILIMRKKRKKAKKQFKMELISREEMIRKASREEFADAQMTIRDIKTDLVTSRVPYCSYQTYICHQLFPNLDVGASPLLQSMITNDNKTTIQSAMDKFDKLLTNKLFLKSLVQTLDRQNKLTVQEKAHLSSLLSITLLGNMRLFYDLINCLLSDMIETASTKQQKVLFRSSTSQYFSEKLEQWPGDELAR